MGKYLARGVNEYQVKVSEAAKAQLRVLPKKIRSNIGYRIHLLQEDLSGDVKKLHGPKHFYRFRVGEYRVLFRLEGTVAEIYAVKTRQEAL